MIRPHALALLCILTMYPLSAASELLFADHFVTGDFSHHSDYFRWGRSGAIERPSGDSDMIVEVAGPDGMPVHAVRFRYGTWQEVRFHLTASRAERRTERGQSNVAYPEVWISYWMRVPENYFHRRSRPNNNKGWIYLWKDSYERWTDSVSDDEVTPTSSSFHWWLISDSPADRNYGLTRVSLVNSRGREGWGHNNSPSFIRAAERIPGTNRPYAFLPEEFGRWVHYTFGMRVASSRGARDGFARVYKDGELAFAWENLDGGADDPAQNGYDRGYLLGYHNSGYDEPTEFYLTDFRVGTSRAAVTVP